jgi:hypothetical protein
MPPAQRARLSDTLLVNRRGFSFRASAPPQKPLPTPRSITRPRATTATRATPKPAPSTAGADPGVSRQIDNLLAMGSGWGPGAKQGALQSARAIADAAIVGVRLFDFTDPWRKPRGEAAVDLLFNGTADALHEVGGAIAHPVATTQALYRRVVPDVSGGDLSADEERRRYFEAGVNQGELAVGLLGGGAAFAPVKTVGKLDRLRPRSKPEKFLAQGFTPEEAAHLAQPYFGWGHHVVKRKTVLPDFLGGGEIPKRFMESPYNKLMPQGMTRGDFYELHYLVDNEFNGARMKKTHSQHWSGKRLGLRRGTLPERMWFGTPTPVKARAVGLPLVVGEALQNNEEGADTP